VAIALTELDQLGSADLATYMSPRPVDSGRGDMMVEAAVLAVKEAVGDRAEVPASAKFIVLEVAKRAYQPRVQQESLGSRSVSYFQPGDPREGIFLTEDELRQLGVYHLPVGVAWTRASNGAGAWTKVPGQRWPWSLDDGGVPL
jgi:hypothetical protein